MPPSAVETMRAWLLSALVVHGAVAGNPDAKRLYDDLLSNYNKLVRPVVNTSDVLRVCIKLKLSQLIDVSGSRVLRIKIIIHEKIFRLNNSVSDSDHKPPKDIRKVEVGSKTNPTPGPAYTTRKSATEKEMRTLDKPKVDHTLAYAKPNGVHSTNTPPAITKPKK
ncbi:hypothetical protein JTB14_015261 [Gonioctena quinquepunctata]|nr:hypothetical protein JTB14_015261 [Gonioctena quinquepunctata]